MKAKIHSFNLTEKKNMLPTQQGILGHHLLGLPRTNVEQTTAQKVGFNLQLNQIIVVILIKFN